MRRMSSPEIRRPENLMTAQELNPTSKAMRLILAWQSSEAERRHLATCLATSNYQLAPSGSTALQDDVTALTLPVRQGEERAALAQITHWRQRRRDLPIVAIIDAPSLAAAVIDAGADDFIQAPVQAERLRLTLDHLIETANLKSQIRALSQSRPQTMSSGHATTSSGQMALAESAREYNHAMTDQQLTEQIRPLDQIERDAIENAIRCCQGDVRKAAHFLNVSAATVYRRIKKWNSDQMSPA